ncbi:MAG: hypothetical protein HC866_04145 [Leptolyngbyaceae cyanobacterium RU_5_1]|nr:hypothetical protein [Leptolyngbyaceae cyanobacterium RU_5_1]
MSYKEFDWAKVKATFELTTVERGRFLPEISPISPSSILAGVLQRTLPWAVMTGNEKARSEAIINPVLLEVREILTPQISVFSGEDFTVDATLGLNGYCDFLISRSSEQISIEAPVVVVVEAKQENLKLGLGQCAATMVAAQRFNQQRQSEITTVYGSVSTGTVWRFIKLEADILTLDPTDYPLPPVDVILGMLVWMVQHG